MSPSGKSKSGASVASREGSNQSRESNLYSSRNGAQESRNNEYGRKGQRRNGKENQANVYSYRMNATKASWQEENEREYVTHRVAAVDGGEVKESRHNNEYELNFIGKDSCSFSKINNDNSNMNSNATSTNFKEEGSSIANMDMDPERARSMYIKKLQSTQSTMHMEGNTDIYKEELMEMKSGKEKMEDCMYSYKNKRMSKSKHKNNNLDDTMDHQLAEEDGDKEMYNHSFYLSDNMEEELSTDGKNISFMKKIKMCFNYFGPGWIVAIAYLDPGNLCSNLNVGLIRSPGDTNNLVKDYTGYHLLWILAYGHILGFIFQVLSMKLGHVTGLDLASICYKEFDKRYSYLLYFFVQIAIWGAHIQAIVGTFVAIHLIFGISVKVAILYTLIEALVYSFLENKSLSLLENVLSVLIGFLAVCFIFNVFMTPINYKEVVYSILYPRIPEGKGFDAMALLGSIISSHVIYLHTNLTSKKRAVIFNDRMLKRYNTLGTVESAGSLFLSCVTNCIIVLTFAEVNIKANERKDAYNLFTAYEVMKKSFGKISMYIWSFGLLSSGNNSSFMCEYASKSVFEGFLNKKINTFLRVLSFRFFLFSILYLFLLYDKYSIDQLTNFINVIQVLLLPLAIVPLYRFSIHKNVLGKFALTKYSKLFVFVIVISIIIANLMLTIFDFIQKVPNIYSVCFAIIFSLLYLAFMVFLFQMPITKTYCRLR
ncbi:transporter, putative [Plasmodium knowlesi strain H]|uniref:Transporter, putative n=3 Tax=Plasmodium knowlesi TaxID=5850 RepID=A0A5K1V544_PLAKH|nr:divalent metal transporter, putative [Plasmodium knowlesi strain H]OTN67086.1 putative Transporter [Plasmodium knowlesi]CAA9988597.1 divalent metal transporter, putative [Plasmodium knowlesi strain H]SBO21421.1 transporter, putative [Plasmodium knowlesi strain H]SBO21871.1 transporter, putative [Plasmodium knowlesi strain H]VVS78071.1 divalent metal transporter, putative [Plasmodium knowlesi strain H]|eukprot:XP_002259573.1 transporter, putative [Plasmodium knowlesi strain H]